MSSAPSRRAVRWALVGSSEFALNWALPALRSASGAEPVAIVTRDPEGMRVRRPDTADLALVAALDQVPALDVDIVHVITPNDLHLPMTLEALALGLHVLVEKPMALSLAEAQLMTRAATEVGRLLAVGSCMAWSPVIDRAREFVQVGDIGGVEHAVLSAGFDARAHLGWRQLTETARGGGVLNDLGPHAIDALVRLLGPVVSVSAQLATREPGFVGDDTAALLLGHSSGARSFVHVSFTHGCNDLTLTGTTGQLIGTEWLGRRFSGELSLVRAERSASDFDPESGGPVFEPQVLAFTDILEQQAVEVSRAVLDSTAPAHAAVADGVHVMAVLEAAQLSSSSGGAVRRLDHPSRRGIHA
jgi:predicted dehydrogenase